MRTRYLKPGFFENEDLAALPATTRLLFAGLWLIADRDGRLKDRAARIKGELFPYDNTNVERGLKQLADAGFVKRYTADDGQRLIWIPSWSRHQRPHPHEPESALERHEDDQCHDMDDPMSGASPPLTRTGTGTGNEDSNSNSNEDGNRDEQAEARRLAAAPSSGGDSSSWDFVRNLYALNVGRLDERDRATLRTYFDRAPPEWLAAAINETSTAKEPGMGYFVSVMESCIAEKRPPSSLKKSHAGRR